MAITATFTEFETKHTPPAQSVECPANTETLKNDGLVEKLDFVPFARGTTDTDSNLTGAQAIEPKPGQQKNEKNGEKAFHGGIVGPFLLQLDALGQISRSVGRTRSPIGQFPQPWDNYLEAALMAERGITGEQDDEASPVPEMY